MNYLSLGCKCISESLFLLDRFSFPPLVLVCSGQATVGEGRKSHRVDTHVSDLESAAAGTVL